MPGTGHSSRYKGSISNRNSKPAFQVLAPWNSKKNGDVNQVPVSSGGGPINFKLVNAKMMSNYNKNTDEFTFDCSVNVTGSTIHTGDVQYQGDVTIDGVLTAQTALIQDLSAINITDVSDNVLTLGNHESDFTQHMRGVFMSHIGDTFDNEFSFMGFDPSGNDCAGIVNDSHGQFVFLTDASFNSTAPADECNIRGEAGRVLVGTLDISGSTRYGNGGTGSGLPTQNVTNQQNSSMHLVGRTIIAQEGTNSAQLDISGGINVVGSSKLTDLSGAHIDISGGNVDIIAAGGDGHISLLSNLGTNSKIEIKNDQGDKGDAVAIKSIYGGIDIIAFSTVDISGGTSVKLSDGAGAYIDISGGKVDISGTTSVQMSASGTGTFSLDHPYIRVGTGSNQYDLGVEIGKAKTVKISGNGSVNLINPLPASNSWGTSANGNSGPCGRIQLNFTPAESIPPLESRKLTLSNNAIMEDSIILLTICGSTAGKSVDLLPSVESQSSGANPGTGGLATFQIKNTGSTTVDFSAAAPLWLNYLIINPASYI